MIDEGFISFWWRRGGTCENLRDQEGDLCVVGKLTTVWKPKKGVSIWNIGESRLLFQLLYHELDLKHIGDRVFGPSHFPGVLGSN